MRELEETNPMLGSRGTRLGLIAPEIYDVQVAAIVAAARAVQERRGEPPRVEIVIPLSVRPSGSYHALVQRR